MKTMVKAIAVIALMVLAGLGALYLPGSLSAGQKTPEPMTVGTGPAELSALVYLADDQGFFRKNGLNVTIKNYDSALSAVRGMENGEADVSVSTEYPVIAEIFALKNVSVIGCIDKYQTTYLVGLKDRGIYNRSDIAAKKIGIARGSVGEFYLGRLLIQNGISLKDVTLVDLKQSQIPKALAERDIDAAIIWSIDPDMVREQFGDNAVIWPAQGGQPTFGVLEVRNTWADGHSPATALFLQSIDDAGQYSLSHPSEARAIVQRRLNATDSHMAAAWPAHQYSLSLDQSLVLAMEDEARWMIANNLTEEKAVPDFRKYIYTKSLKEIKPGSVNIVG